MKVLVTGAKGFIAKNLIAALENVIASIQQGYGKGISAGLLQIL